MNENTNNDGRRNLANAITGKVAEGYRVESQTDIQATLVRGHKPNHILHLILTLITFGVWLFVWIPLVFIQKERRCILTTDEFGNVLTQQIG
jgi:hypothetical protein